VFRPLLAGPDFSPIAARFHASQPGCHHLLDCTTFAVTADSFWRFSSVGLL